MSTSTSGTSGSGSSTTSKMKDFFTKPMTKLSEWVHPGLQHSLFIHSIKLMYTISRP